MHARQEHRYIQTDAHPERGWKHVFFKDESFTAYFGTQDINFVNYVQTGTYSPSVKIRQ